MEFDKLCISIAVNFNKHAAKKKRTDAENLDFLKAAARKFEDRLRVKGKMSVNAASKKKISNGFINPFMNNDQGTCYVFFQ